MEKFPRPNSSNDNFSLEERFEPIGREKWSARCTVVAEVATELAQVASRALEVSDGRKQAEAIIDMMLLISRLKGAFPGSEVDAGK